MRRRSFFSVVENRRYCRTVHGYPACLVARGPLMPDSFQHDGVRFLHPTGVKLPRRLGLEWIHGAAIGWFQHPADAG